MRHIMPFFNKTQIPGILFKSMIPLIKISLGLSSISTQLCVVQMTELNVQLTKYWHNNNVSKSNSSNSLEVGISSSLSLPKLTWLLLDENKSIN